jgi:hypothetical protein
VDLYRGSLGGLSTAALGSSYLYAKQANKIRQHIKTCKYPNLQQDGEMFFPNHDFFHPGSSISDPGPNNNEKEEEKK